ncbi:MAG: hypothetical protein K0Q87_163 [Neobacillus sp.]|jgi:hypothetical protein|nr:hypothetical protein [Neobacillus sp.]
MPQNIDRYVWAAIIVGLAAAAYEVLRVWFPQDLTNLHNWWTSVIPSVSGFIGYFIH